MSAASFLAVLFAIPCSFAADRPDYTIRAQANEVRVTFSALDQNQRSIANLQPNDFVVVDKDFIVRNYQSFTSVQSTKVDLAVLVDTSASMNPRFQSAVAAALELLSSSNEIPEEDVSFFAFHNLEPATICSGNCRATDMTQRLAQLSSNGSTPLYDSISYAADFLAAHSEPQAQKVLILLSDGEDTISRKGLQDTAADLLRNGVQIHTIDLSLNANHGAAVLEWLANTSGGRFFKSDRDVSAALQSILDALHSSYTVTYQLPNQARGFHSIRIVPTHNLNLQFHHRSGYYYPDSAQLGQ